MPVKGTKNTEIKAFLIVINFTDVFISNFLLSLQALITYHNVKGKALFPPDV